MVGRDSARVGRCAHRPRLRRRVARRPAAASPRRRRRASIRGPWPPPLCRRLRGRRRLPGVLGRSQAGPAGAGRAAAPDEGQRGAAAAVADRRRRIRPRSALRQPAAVANAAGARSRLLPRRPDAVARRRRGAEARPLAIPRMAAVARDLPRRAGLVPDRLLRRGVRAVGADRRHDTGDAVPGRLRLPAGHDPARRAGLDRRLRRAVADTGAAAARRRSSSCSCSPTRCWRS